MDLQSMRIKHGYTQRDLAKQCGITQSRLSQIERTQIGLRQDTGITAETLYKLSKVLGFRMEDWFEEVHDKG